MYCTKVRVCSVQQYRMILITLKAQSACIVRDKQKYKRAFGVLLDLHLICEVSFACERTKLK